MSSKVIGDYTYLWYDVRPHPNFGTVEVRVHGLADARRAHARARGADPGNVSRLPAFRFHAERVVREILARYMQHTPA